MKMIACMAYMARYELNEDSLVYACLAGIAVNNLIKGTGVKFATKFATSLVKKYLVKHSQK